MGICLWAWQVVFAGYPTSLAHNNINMIVQCQNTIAKADPCNIGK